MAIIQEYGSIAHSIAPVKDPTGEFRNAEILASKEVSLGAAPRIILALSQTPKHAFAHKSPSIATLNHPVIL